MSESTPDLQALTKRLEKVERQNRKIKLAGFLVLILVGFKAFTIRVVALGRLKHE